METRLEPLEKPAFPLNMAYIFSKLKFGKVLSPLKIVYSRLPLAFGLFANKISSLEKKMVLDKELVYLIRHRVAQINVCSFCMDIGVAIAMKDRMHEEKFAELEDYRTSSVFSLREKAAIQFAEELTKYKKIEHGTFEQAKKLFNPTELAEIAWTVATEHYYNMVNLAFEIESDQLCQLQVRVK